MSLYCDQPVSPQPGNTYNFFIKYKVILQTLSKCPTWTK